MVSTTATNAYLNWSGATTYAEGAIVSYNGSYWESIQSTNLNKTPTTEPLWWIFLGADNRHAMFDLAVSTQTTATTELTVVVKPGVVINSLAMINVDANVIYVTIRDGISGPIIYENSAGLSGANVTNWYDYFFNDPLLKRKQIVFSGIPPYANAHITLTLEGASGETVGIGSMIYGDLASLGGTQYGTSAGIVDYSVKQTDEFGTISFVERAYSKRLSANFFIPTGELNRVQSYLYSIRATPAVWVATDNPTFEEVMIVYGFMKDFTTTISYPSHSLCNIEIEGLT